MKLISIAIFFLGFSTATYSQQCKISGGWKHADKTAWFNIDIHAGEVTVQRHEKFPQVVGSVLMKKLRADSVNTGQWLATMYSGDQDAYVPVQIKSENCDKLIVFHNNSEVLKLHR
jgi:hypothetical protein